MTGRIAVVTGAAGFIGRRLVTALRATGDEVRGIDIRAGDGVLPGDVTRLGSWTAALDGADLVVHCAARVDYAGTRAQFAAINVEGTRTVLAAAREAGVGRTVHLSTIAVYGVGDHPQPLTEADPVDPFGGHYADTKIAAEHLALLAIADGQPVTVVRPGDVYGPGSPLWTVRMLQLIGQGWLAAPRDGLLNPVFIDDLIDGILAAATTEAATGRVYNLVGSPGVATSLFLDHYAGWLGKGLRTVPDRIAVAGSRVLERAAAAVGRSAPLTTEAVRYGAARRRVSSQRARDELGWAPQVDLEAGMAATRRWADEVGLLV